jgi:hypothetical protein
MKPNTAKALPERTLQLYGDHEKFDAIEFERQLVEKGCKTDQAREIAEKMAITKANSTDSTDAKPIQKPKITVVNLKQVTAVARARKARDEAETPRQLPLWADLERAMPTTVLRSALFAPIGRGARKLHKNAVIDSRPDVELTYTGEQLDMSDAVVLMQTLELAKRHKLGTEFAVNRAKFLTVIGRAFESRNTSTGTLRRKAIGSTAYEWLDTSIKRLREGSLNFQIKETTKRKTRGGILNFIKTWKWDDESNCYLLAVDPEIYKLFESFSRIYLDKHLALPRSDQLSQWMHLYVAGCKKGEIMRIGLHHLRAYTGNKHRRMDHFEASMKRSLKALQDAEIIAPGWFIREIDLMVHFTRIV